MKVRLFGLTCLLTISMSLNSVNPVQKKRTNEEQLFIDAATTGDTFVMRNLLDKGALRGTQDYTDLLWNIYTSEGGIYAPYEVVMNVFELLEKYFKLTEEDTDQVIAQSHNDIDRGKLKKSIAILRQTLEQRRMNQQLIKAAKEGKAHLVKELLKKGAEIITYRWDEPESLGWAAIQGHTEIMDILLDDLQYISHKGYSGLSEVGADRQRFVPLFQRNVTSLEEQMKCIERVRLYRKSSSNATSFLRVIEAYLKTCLSRDIIFTFFSSHNTALRLALKAIGAQELTHAPHALLPDRQEHLNRLLLFAAQVDDELVKALIDEGAEVATVNEFEPNRTPLHVAAYFENMRAARILLRAGAPIDATDRYGATPLYVNGRIIRRGVAKLLLESGATLEDNTMQMNDTTLSQETITTVLEASVRRFGPPHTQAKRALQNVAFLIYILGIKLNLPYYVIHEIICFATSEQDAPGRCTHEYGRIGSRLWSAILKNHLEDLYLYQCNGNQLLHLWEQTIRCIAKDPQDQLKLTSRLGKYLEPFRANDVKRFVCLRIMHEVAAGKKIVGDKEKENTDEILVDNFKLYFDHLDRYLQMSGFDEE